jgi:hypothetical protein
MRSQLLTAPFAKFVVSMAILAGVAGGCRQSEFAAVPVSGRVTLNRKPLAGVHVGFQPSGGNSGSGKVGVGSVGITDAEGRFQLKMIESNEPGAVVGRHVVRLTAKELRESHAGDAAPVLKNPLPPQSQDGSMNFEVPPGGTDQANFDLKF